MKVNKLKDWAERTIWTFAAAFFALGSADWVTGLNVNTWDKVKTALVAAAFTTVKTVVAQHAGDEDYGAAIPGGVSEPQ